MMYLCIDAQRAQTHFCSFRTCFACLSVSMRTATVTAAPAGADNVLLAKQHVSKSGFMGVNGSAAVKVSPTEPQSAGL